MIDVYAALQRVIELGHQGENLHTRVVFDVSQYLMKYPDATFILLHRQPDTEAAYPVLDVSRNGEFLYWRVTSGDLTRAGNGRCELLVLQDNVICKSDIYKTCIQMALDGSGTAPEPWESWQILMKGMRDDANEAAERADYAALRAETAAEAVFDMGAEAETLSAGSDATVDKTIDPETGAVTLAFGIPRGEQGIQGPQGETGATGATPDISIGTVTTLEPGESATATITGTAEEPVLNLGIPQGEPGEVTMQQITAILPTDTASGAVASFPDGTDIVPAQHVVAHIEPVQDLHGYDNPWPAGGGKNKVDIPFATVSFQSVLYSVDMSAGQYTLSATCANNTTIGGYLSLRLSGVAKGTITIASGDSGVRKSTTFTLTEDGRYDVVGSGAASGYNFTVANVQLEAGSSETAYSPYENICPITGWTGTNVVRTGKNLLDKSTATGTTIVWFDRKILLKAGITYCYSCDSAYPPGSISIYDETKTNQLAYGTSTSAALITYTPTEDTYVYPRFYKSTGVAQETIDTAMIEIGTTRTSYAPYTGTTTPISWESVAGTVYGGTLDVVTGVLTVDWTTVDMGTLSWVYYSQYASFVAPVNNKIPYVNDHYDYGIMSSSFRAVNIWWTQSSKPDKTMSCGAQTNICIKHTGFTNAAEFKAAVSGVQLVYKLATPQTYQLTPTEVRMLLGDNNVWADTGSVDVTYKADIQRYIDKRLGTGTQTLGLSLSRPALTVEPDMQDNTSGGDAE